MLRGLILDQGYCIEIWVCDNRQWKLDKKASPGNLSEIEDLLFTQSELISTPVVAAISVDSKDQKIVGVSFVDASSDRTFGVCEFIDNESFSNLESLLIQTGVKECVIPDDRGLDFDKIRKLLERCKILLEDSSNLSAFEIKQYDLAQYMKLDASAVSALNLAPGPRDSNKNMNLFGLLNKCKTAQGSRLLGQWIKQPLMVVAQIEARQSIVKVLVEDTGLRQSIYEMLGQFPDLHRLAKKFQRAKGSLQDVVRVYQVIKKVPDLLDKLSQTDHPLFKELFVDKINVIYTYESNMESLTRLAELAESTIDLEATDRHEYLIKADFDPLLQDIRTKMDGILNQLEPEAKRVASYFDIEYEKKLKFENNPQYGYHLRVSRIEASKIRNDKSIIQLRTQKAGLLFTTATLQNLSNSHAELVKDYSKQQSSISKEVIAITGTYFPVLELTNQIVAQIDVFISLALAAVHAPTAYICPKVTAAGDIKLKGARHPCVELQDDVSFISNDVELINNQSMFHIITGPNMGGKSTYIRQIGVICLLAQMGSYVPCDEAELCVVDAILARVGAGDCQVKGISTFMAEMLETSAILRSATSRSLIIVDELGRGTSTKDGFGLAWAIAEHIAKLGCFTLFATHFHEITSLSDYITIVENYHVDAFLSDGEERCLTLLYKVLPGASDQSFGISVAELAQFPSSVIQLAKRKAFELEGLKDCKKWKSDDCAIKSGRKIISDFLSEYSSLSHDDREIGLKLIIARYDAKFIQSSYVQELIHEF